MPGRELTRAERLEELRMRLLAKGATGRRDNILLAEVRELVEGLERAAEARGDDGEKH